MIPKGLDQITETDLQALITNAVAEGRTIEYKRELPGTSDNDKREFLADVSSFANTSGGDLIYGIEESQGAPTQISGLAITDPDLQTRRLDDMLASGLEPRIRYLSRFVQCRSGPVLLIRTEKSWIGPHRVVFRGHDKFYGRNNAGKFPLDVEQLRQAFTLASGVADKIRAFRTDRIIDLTNNVTPLPFVDAPKLVLHLLPVEAFAGQARFDVIPLAANPMAVLPMAAGTVQVRINLDGIIGFATAGGTDPLVRTYMQVYRNGIIEAVNGSLLCGEYEGRPIIPSIAYEQRPLDHLTRCFALLQNIGVQPPVIAALTLIGVRGRYFVYGDIPFREFSHAITTDTLILPETWVEDFSSPSGKILQPMFDMVWNACGLARSPNFDRDGNWIARRG